MSSSEKQRPNILFIFPDQWRYDGLSCMNNPVAETPFLDDIFQTGTVFSTAYTNVPTCIAARACLMTGKTPQYTGRHGYQDSQPWNYANMYPQLLRNSGYQTLLAGKTHFHPARVHLGYEQINLYDNQRWGEDFTSDYDQWLHERTNGLINDTAMELNSNSMVVHPWTHDEALHANSWTVTKGMQMLKHRDPTRPFMLQLNFHRPHPPIDPPVEYLRRFESKPLGNIAAGEWSEKFADNRWDFVSFSGKPPADIFKRARHGYYAQLAHIDFQIGRILRYLQLNGMQNNTMIIFASDHGEMLGDHNLFRKGYPLEGSARIPLAIKLPQSWGISQSGEVKANPVGLHDIMPTILEAADVGIPDDIQGKSLIPLVRGENPHWREFTAIEHTNIPVFGSYQALCDGRQKYAWNTGSGEEFLFDIDTDPTESVNLAQDSSYCGDIKNWRKKLAEHIGYYEKYGLVKNGELTPGNILPTTENWVKEGLQTPA